MGIPKDLGAACYDMRALCLQNVTHIRDPSIIVYMPTRGCLSFFFFLFLHDALSHLGLGHQNETLPKDPPGLNRVKSVLLIFTKEKSATKFERDTEEFYNPEVTVVTVEGSPNKLYAQNMGYHHYYDEIMKHFGEDQLKNLGAFQNDLQLHDVNITSYYTDKYALWLDFQTIDDNKLHGWVGN